MVEKPIAKCLDLEALSLSLSLSPWFFPILTTLSKWSINTFILTDLGKVEFSKLIYNLVIPGTCLSYRLIDSIVGLICVIVWGYFSLLLPVLCSKQIPAKANRRIL